MIQRVSIQSNLSTSIKKFYFNYYSETIKNFNDHRMYITKFFLTDAISNDTNRILLFGRKSSKN